MAAITIPDLENAKVDVDHIAAIATSTAPTATDRLGHVKKTMAGASADVSASVAAVEASKNTAVNTTIPGQVAAVEVRKNTAINTEIPAAVALVDTAVAQTAAGSATAAKVAAEAARDAAMVGAKFYASEADGRAGVLDGDYFKVANGKYISLYLRVSASTSTFVSNIATELQITEQNQQTLKAVSVRKRPRGKDTGSEKIFFGAAKNKFLIGIQQKIPRGKRNTSHGAVPVLGGSQITPVVMKKRPRGKDNVSDAVIVSGESILLYPSTSTKIQTAEVASTANYLSSIGKPHPSYLASTDGSGQIVIYGQGGSQVITSDAFPWSGVSIGLFNISSGINSKSGFAKAYSITKRGMQLKNNSFVLHKLVTGQSLALGSRGFVLDENGQYLIEGTRRGNLFSDFVQPGLAGRMLTLPGGPRPTSWVGAASFEDAKEYANSVAGETPASSYMLATLKLYDENTAAMPKLLYSISAQGGVPYSELKKGTLVYTRALEHVTAAKNICLSSGLEYSVPSISIVHGESQLGTPQAEYVGMLNEWVSDYRADIVSITGQAIAPIAFISQCNTGPVGSNSVPAIPLAQLQAHNENENIVLIGPKYQYQYFDNYHLLAEGYVKLGELEAFAELLTLTGNKWQPLKVDSYSVSSDEITIKLNNKPFGGVTTSGPIGKIAIDTETVSDPGSYGFNLSSGSIASVSPGKDGASIVIKAFSVISAGTKLSYALQTDLQYPQNGNGRRGCIRDTDTRIYSRFDNKPLHNWLCSFEITL